MTKFEMGIIDPRNNEFDHHSAIAPENAFIAKMASVQLIESLIIKDSIKDFKLENVEYNHLGHLDDFILFSIAYAHNRKKLRNLYAFACRISALDSLGPCAYKLLNDSDRDIVGKAYEAFQKEVTIISKKHGIDRWKLSTDQKINAAYMASHVIVNSLDVDDYTEPEAWVPDENHYSIEEKHDGLWAIEVLDSAMNPLRASSYFYNHGCKIMIAYTYHEETGRWGYAISSRSAYDYDLSWLWGELNLIDPVAHESDNKWGGHSGAGGAPRKNGDFEGGSELAPSIIFEMIKEH